MALNKTITSGHGVNIVDAYVRIENLSGDKTRIELTVATYVNQQGFFDGKIPLMLSMHSFIPSVDDGADNFIKQGYEHIKSLPEFVDAIDC